jgi:Rieske Fe-S protein
MSKTPAWKDDFPVSWADDHFVTRRQFTKSLTLLSGATFCASGALAVLGRVTVPGSGETVTPRKIASVGEIPVGGVRSFEFPEPGEPCLLIRSAPDRFVAFSQRCTHLGCPVLYRAASRQLHCPCHEGYFDAEDGRVLAGPPPRPLPRIRLERKGDELWATGFQA